MLKRLLCIVSSMDTGGAETFIMKIFRGLDKTKYQMDFIVCADGFYDNEITDCGGEIYHVPLRTKKPFKVYNLIKKIVKKNQYKSVLKLGNSPMCVIDLLAAKKGGAKVLAMRSCNALTNLSFKQKVMDFIFRPILNKIANVKIAPSDLSAKYTFGEKKYRKGEVQILNNGVDLSKFCYTEEDRVKIRKEFDINENFVVGHIGRFSKQKNHKFLLSIFSKIKEKKDDAKLLLIGTGELEDQIRGFAEKLEVLDDIVFTGVRTDVSSLLSAMDVFIFPSLYEGMPNTVIEAQATGLPCVISDTITRQANITGLVNYLSLDDSFENWASKALEISTSPRKNTKEDFLEAKYDIESVRKLFIKLLYNY